MAQIVNSRPLSRLGVGLAACGAAAVVGLSAPAASASIVFSDVQITGSLSSGVTFITTPSDIDFTMTSTRVGDPSDPVRDGNLLITFVATVTDGPAISMDHASILGALAGSGQIFFNEIVEDNVTGDRLGTYNAHITDNSQLPLGADIPFSPGTQIKVKKSFYLVALPTDAFDVAQVGFVEQRFVPTPGSLALLACGGMLLRRRRR